MRPAERLTIIVPAPHVEAARAILGPDSFLCPITNPGGNHITHYASGAHPSQVTPEQLAALEDLPAVQIHPITLPFEDVLDGQNLRRFGDLGLPDEEPVDIGGGGKGGQL